MQLTVADLSRHAVRLVIPYAEGEVAVDYRPAKITREYGEALDAILARTRALAEADDSPESEAEAEAIMSETSVLFCEVVAGWDVLEEEGGPLMPVTPERIRQLLEQPGGGDFCGEVLSRCARAQRLGERNGNGSTPRSVSRSPAGTGQRTRRSAPRSKRSQARA